MDSNIYYEEKYIKYKKKYLDLKQELEGGAKENCVCALPTAVKPAEKVAGLAAMELQKTAMELQKTAIKVKPVLSVTNTKQLQKAVTKTMQLQKAVTKTTKVVSPPPPAKPQPQPQPQPPPAKPQPQPPPAKPQPQPPPAKPQPQPAKPGTTVIVNTVIAAKPQPPSAKPPAVQTTVQKSKIDGNFLDFCLFNITEADDNVRDNFITNFNRITYAIKTSNKINTQTDVNDTIINNYTEDNELKKIINNIFRSKLQTFLTNNLKIFK